MAAAAELVIESGVRSLTLARVSERAGYSRGIVTHYFGSKQGLIDALARALQEGFVPGLAEKPPGLDRLLALIDGYLGARARSSTAGHAFLVLWSEAVTDTELAPTFRERDSAFRNAIAEDVAAGIAEGTIRDTVHPEAVAVAVVGQLRGIGMQRLLDVDAVDVERLRTEVIEQWRRALSADSR
ncbi:TetR family transcriptional regulator [Streptomyces minutiscleroticus]|uniref:TetR family transcriptional regulator n=2 Tax=Streptomyces minutiscleroticus TaxID=68238 RepID=A0A918P2C4_9ACTN|nr:TetR family transcriptional regulator [Streptomyces minutiscleroticus]